MDFCWACVNLQSKEDAFISVYLGVQISILNISDISAQAINPESGSRKSRIMGALSQPSIYKTPQNTLLMGSSGTGKAETCKPRIVDTFT